MPLVTLSTFWTVRCSLTFGTYLEPKVVTLNHRLSVVLLQRGGLQLIDLSIALQREHVVHSVNGVTHPGAQLKRIILRSPKPQSVQREANQH